jgi:plasmid stability protein
MLLHTPAGAHEMPILHVRNVPESLYGQLRRRAASQGRSVSAEVIRLLEQALEEPERDQGEILASLRRQRSFRPADVGAPDSTSLLRENRAR